VTSKAEKNISSLRRSALRAAAVISRLVTKPKSAVVVTACPAEPSLIARSAATGVRRLAGRNSAVTRLKTPIVMEATADQAGTCRPPAPRS